MGWQKHRTGWGWRRVYPEPAAEKNCSSDSMDNKNIIVIDDDDDDFKPGCFSDSADGACKKFATSSPKVPHIVDSDVKPANLLIPKSENFPCSPYRDTYDDYQNSLSDSGLGITVDTTPDDDFSDSSQNVVKLSPKYYPKTEVKIELSTENFSSVNTVCKKEIMPKPPINENAIAPAEKLLTSTPCSAHITNSFKRKIDSIEDLENKVPVIKKIKSSDSDDEQTPLNQNQVPLMIKKIKKSDSDDEQTPLNQNQVPFMIKKIKSSDSDDDDEEPSSLNQNRESPREINNSSMDEAEDDELLFLNNDEMTALFNAGSENEDEPPMMNAAELFQSMQEPIDFTAESLRNSTTHFRRNDLGHQAQITYSDEQRRTNICIKKLFVDLQEMPKEFCEVDPAGLNIKLMLHQQYALGWMKWREGREIAGGILADDMGLGKTLEIIALVLSAKNEKKARELAAGTAVESFGDLSRYFKDHNVPTPEICKGRTLIVCPPSLLEQWEREIFSRVQKGKLQVLIYHGPSRTNNMDVTKMALYDIVLTSYHIVANEKEQGDSWLFKIDWERVVLDEAHFIRNRKVRWSIAVCELKTKARWALTGTPIQNGEVDMYALLKFLKCEPFDEWKIWKDWVSNNNKLGIRRLKIIVKVILLRRTKVELMNKGLMERLPEKIYKEIHVKLDPKEMIVYQKLLLYSVTFFEEFLRQKKEKEDLMNGVGCYRPRRKSLMSGVVPRKISKALKVLMRTHDDRVSYNCILVLILRLRQMCCHPALIKSMLDKLEIDPGQANGLDAEPQPMRLNDAVLAELENFYSNNNNDDDDDEEDQDEFDEQKAKNLLSKDNMVFRDDRQSSKVIEILDTVEKILDMGEKMIVVSQWTGFLQVIGKNLTKKKIKFEMFSGKVPLKKRQEIVDRLNNKNDDTLEVLLLSLTAGGVGLNLTGANHLLLIDLHWNPQWETQAQDRIYRLGQNNAVHVYKFICKDTIEENIKALQDGKLQIADSILSGKGGNRLSLEDLKMLFSLKKDVLQKSGGNQDVEMPEAPENN